MKNFLAISQVVFSVLMALTILSQSKGAGLSSAFGGTGAFYHTKRGPEKVLFVLTIIFAVLFVLNAVAFIFVE